MTMERARATWTDERLDDLSPADRIDARFDELERRIDALHRGVVQFGTGITLLVLATLVSVIATRA